MIRLPNFLLALALVAGLILGAPLPAKAADLTPVASASSYTAGAISTYTLEFSLIDPYGSTPNDVITVTFPEEYDLTNTNSGSVVMQSMRGEGSWNPVSITVNVTGQSVSLKNDSSSSLNPGDKVRIAIPDVINSARLTTFGYTQYFSIQVHIQHGSSTPSCSGTASVCISAGPMSGLVLTGPSSISAGSRRAFEVIGTDQFGNLALPDGVTGVTVYLSTSHTDTGIFYNNPAGGSPVTSVVINSGVSSATFYYYDTTFGPCTLTASDGEGGLEDASFSLDIMDNNDPALNGVPESITIPEMTYHTFTVTADDPDLPAQTLTFSVSGPIPASVIPGDTGVVICLQPAEEHGPGIYLLTVSVSDGLVTTSRTVVVTVTEVNLAPQMASIGNRSVDEETTLTFTVSAVDVDLPLNTLTYSLIGAPEGAAIDALTGDFTWTPTEAQGPGIYTFDVQVSDGLAVDTEIITVTVNEVNASPVAEPDVAETPEDSAVVIDILVNDSDYDADILTVRSIVTPPAHGMAVINDDNTVTYTPQADYYGSDSFVYEINDGNGNYSQALVTVNILPVNDAPVVEGIKNQSINRGEAFAAFDLDDYITDVDTPVDQVIWSHSGEIDLNVSIDAETHVVTVTYPVGWYGSETITFTADDGELTASDAAVFQVNNPHPPALALPVGVVVDVSVVGEGWVTVNPQSPHYAGDTVTLTAVPADGWFFAGWSGSLTGTENPAGLYLNGGKSVTATFVQTLYTLTIHTVGEGTVSASGSGFYRYGDKVTLTATPGEDFRFGRWSGDVRGIDNPVEIIMDADKSVTVFFQWVDPDPPDNNSPPEGSEVPGGSAGNGDKVSGGDSTPSITPSSLPDSTSDIQEEIEESYNWWWIIGLVLAAAALGVILSFMIRRNHSGLDL
jgi:hypothetical protein